MRVDFTSLLAPIRDEAPCGDDISFEQIISDIQDARRADDPHAAQGDWEVELKQADWHKARQYCLAALSTQSKDLQVAIWLVEAHTQLEGLNALADGLDWLTLLIQQYWDNLHPQGDGDYEERVGRLDWFDRNFESLLHHVPVSGEDGQRFTVLDWYMARDLEQLAQRDSSAYAQAISAGRLSLEQLEKDAARSGAATFNQLYASMQRVQAARHNLLTQLNQQMGNDAPAFRDSEKALDRFATFCGQLRQRYGDSMLEPARASQAESSLSARPTIQATSSPPVHQAASGPMTRTAAIKQLSDIAQFFRDTEPHSPVAYLADKAAHWANLPLDQWLKHVVKDHSVLASLQEMLGVKASESNY